MAQWRLNEHELIGQSAAQQRFWLNDHGISPQCQALAVSFNAAAGAEPFFWNTNSFNVKVCLVPDEQRDKTKQAFFSVVSPFVKALKVNVGFVLCWLDEQNMIFRFAIEHLPRLTGISMIVGMCTDLFIFIGLCVFQFRTTQRP